MKTKKANYDPPGWLIWNWDGVVRLDIERAQQFNDFRIRMCEALGEDNELCNPTNLFRIAMDLLIQNEAKLLATVDGKPFTAPQLLKNKVGEEE